MLKDTIEIFRYKNHICGYGILGSTPNEDSKETLDKLVEWSKLNNYIIYKHIVRHVQENIDLNGPKYHFYSSECPFQEIPYCDLVYYLDIYYQEKI